MTPPMKARIKAKHQRLILAVLAAVAILGAVLLAMSALKDQAAYFYAPADVKRLGVALNKPVRLGGMVAAHSIVKAADGVTINFVVEDGVSAVKVRYTGITPDLFREKSGVIAEGSFIAPDQFVASTILAKHDEKYMPPQMGQKPKIGRVE